MVDYLNIDNINNNMEFNLNYSKNGKKIDNKINFTKINNTIKIKLDSKHLYTIKTFTHIDLEFITNSSNEPFKSKILLLTRKFIWSQKYKIKIMKYLQNNPENCFEFILCK